MKNPSSPLQALRTAINRLEQNASDRATVEAAIAAQQQAIIVAAPNSAALDQAQGQLEDALAVTASGGTPSTDVTVLAERLREAQKDFEKASAIAATQIDLAERTLAGLIRRQTALCETGLLGHEWINALNAWLINEQDQAAHAYTAAVNDLLAHYARLKAIEIYGSPYLARPGSPILRGELGGIPRPQSVPDLAESVARNPGSEEWMFNPNSLAAFIAQTVDTLRAECPFPPM